MFSCIQATSLRLRVFTLEKTQWPEKGESKGMAAIKDNGPPRLEAQVLIWLYSHPRDIEKATPVVVNRG